jgi:hypothetical protein
MGVLPTTPENHGVVVRTNFGDDLAWEDLVDLLREWADAFDVLVTFVDDHAYRDLTPQRLATNENEESSFVVLADATALSGKEHAVLVVDLKKEPGRSFRVLPPQFGPVLANLGIANMDFADFADSADSAGGVHQGF